jgi:dTDP-4-dehydrorhamnose 3,5-epimerase
VRPCRRPISGNASATWLTGWGREPFPLHVEGCGGSLFTRIPFQKCLLSASRPSSPDASSRGRPRERRRVLAPDALGLEGEQHRFHGTAFRRGAGTPSVKVERVPRISGALVFTPEPHRDDRGFFCRTFDVDDARAAGIDPNSFTQDSVSRSSKGVLRGLHMRRGAGESKLVRCSYGAVFDVIVDLRPSSPTYRNWESFELLGDEQMSLYIPAGCAHGFQALTEPADVSYRIDRPHDPTEDVTIAFDDPELAISWPLPVAAISPRDREAPSLSSVLQSL